MTSLPSVMGRRFARLSALLVVPAFLFGASAFTPLVASAHAQDAKPDAKQDEKTYMLARVYKVKDVSKYKFAVTSTINSPQLGGMVDIILDMALRETVKDVKSNGDAIIINEFDSASFKMGPNAMETDITAFLPTITSTIDKSGKAVDVVVDGGNPQFTTGPGSAMFKSFQQQNFFPGKPVKVGDTWKIDLDIKGGPKATGNATLVGTETINGLQTVKIKVVTDSELTQDNPETPNKPVTIKSHAETVGNYEISTGRIVKVNTKTTADGGVVGKTDVLMTLITDTKTPAKKAGDK